MKLFSVHDSKAQNYFNPITHRNAGEALRAFETTVKDVKSLFHMYPSDFTLVELGSFDTDTGSITTHKSPVILANASDFQSQSLQS